MTSGGREPRRPDVGGEMTQRARTGGRPNGDRRGPRGALATIACLAILLGACDSAVAPLATDVAPAIVASPSSVPTSLGPEASGPGAGAVGAEASSGSTGGSTRGTPSAAPEPSTGAAPPPTRAPFSFR